MPFKPFTKTLKDKRSCQLVQVVVIVTLFSLALSACSSIPLKEDNQSSTSAKSEQQIEIPANPSTESNLNANENSLGEEEIESAGPPAINLYLQQQAQHPVIVPEKVLANYQQALSLMKGKKWQQAHAMFDQVIVQQPNLSGSYVNKAIIAKQTGELEQAQKLLTTAISINKLNLYAHHLQGQIYRLQGEFGKAEESYLAAIAIWPDFAEAHVSMAVLLELYRGRLIDAHNYYRSYLLLNRDDEEVKRWQAGLEIKIKRAGLKIPVVEKPKSPNVELQSDNQDVLDEKSGAVNAKEEQ